MSLVWNVTTACDKALHPRGRSSSPVFCTCGVFHCMAVICKVMESHCIDARCKGKSGKDEKLSQWRERWMEAVFLLSAVSMNKDFDHPERTVLCFCPLLPIN